MLRYIYFEPFRERSPIFESKKIIVDTRGLAVEALHPAAAEPHPAIRLSGDPGPDLLTNQQFGRLRTEMCFKSKILNCILYYLFVCLVLAELKFCLTFGDLFQRFNFTSGIPPLNTVCTETDFVVIIQHLFSISLKVLKIASRKLNL